MGFYNENDWLVLATGTRDVINMVDFNEYKRRQGAPGIKITQRAFGRDRRYPITNKFKLR